MSQDPGPTTTKAFAASLDGLRGRVESAGTGPDCEDLAAWRAQADRDKHRARLLAHLRVPADAGMLAGKPSFRGARNVGSEVPRLLGKTAKKFGFTDAGLLTHWTEVIGTRLAQVAQPEKLVRRRRGGAILVLRVAGAAAMEVQHRKPQLIARINEYLGGPAIADLQIVQGPLPRRPAPTAPPRPLTADEEAVIAASLADFPEGRLRNALAILGTELIRRRA